MLLIVWCLLGVAGWWWLLRQSVRGPGGLAPVGHWHVGDAIFAALVGLDVIWTVAADDGKQVAVTPEMIRDGTTFYAVLIGLFCMVSFRRGQDPQQAFGLVPRQPWRVVLLGLACIVLTFPLVQGAEEVAVRAGHPPSDGDPLIQFFGGHPSVSDTIWAIVLALVAAPLTEELIFRGYLYGVMRKYAGRWAAMFTSALLFAAMHQNLPAMPAYFLLAVGLTLAYEITGSLWTPIIMHFLFNLVPVVVILRFPEWMPKS